MSYHILIVEDDPALRQLYGLYLERGQFKHTAVSSVEAALDTLSKLPIDLMMTDVNLGEEIDGLGLINIIRDNEAYNHLKIVILTSFPEHYDVDNADYIHLSLNKPINYSKLMTSLHKILEKDI
jgi:CheY-like chemotaxis protein